jgi:hypothetical protein
MPYFVDRYFLGAKLLYRNHMNLNAGETKVISFFRKAKVLTFDYVLYTSGIFLTQIILNKFVFFLYSKQYLFQRVDYLFSHVTKLLELTLVIFFSFYSIGTFLMLTSA